VLSKSVEDAIADLPGSFGGHIAKCDAGAARRDHQPRSTRLFANFGRDLRDFIGDDDILIDSETGLLQAKRDLGAGVIDPKPLKT
jgi:hypothetical protein